MIGNLLSECGRNYWLDKHLGNSNRFHVMKTDVEMPMTRRIYPRSVIERVVNDMQGIIAGRGLVGHLDHQHDSMIHLAEASHLIKKMELINDDLFIEVEYLNTPCGRLLKQLMESCDIVFAMSGMGNGTVNEDGMLIVNDSYKLVTINAVAGDGKTKFGNS